MKPAAKLPPKSSSKKANSLKSPVKPSTPPRAKAEKAPQPAVQAPAPGQAPRAAPLPPVASHAAEAPIYGHMTNSIDRMVRAMEDRASIINRGMVIICGLILAFMMAGFFATTLALQQGIKDSTRSMATPS